MNLVTNYTTNNPCYASNVNKVDSRYTNFQKNGPSGLMLHSIGVGQNKASVIVNNFNKPNAGASVHAVLQEDGTVVQCLPWNYRAWHCGGSANNTHIGVEMTEPDCIRYTQGATFTCSDLSRARAQVAGTYKTAVELFAYLCKKFNLDPLKDGVIISHAEGHKRGVASGHVDCDHLWNQLGTGYTMDGFRRDVKVAMSGSSSNSGSSSSSSSSSNSSSGSSSSSSSSSPSSSAMYRIRKSWADAASQIGAYSSLENAKKAWKEGYYIFDSNGNIVYPKPLAVGNEVHLVAGATYTNGQPIPAWVINSTLYVREIRGSDIVFSTLKTGAVTGIAAAKYFKGASSSTVPSSSSYMVTVTASSLNIRKGPGTSYPVVGSIAKGGAYTIVETSGNWGLLKSYEKDRNGWICLDYTEKV